MVIQDASDADDVRMFPTRYHFDTLEEANTNAESTLREMNTKDNIVKFATKTATGAYRVETSREIDTTDDVHVLGFEIWQVVRPEKFSLAFMNGFTTADFYGNHLIRVIKVYFG